MTAGKKTGAARLVVCLFCMVLAVLAPLRASAQDEEKPISFARKLEITVTNSIAFERNGESVVIPLSQIRSTAADFNASFFRVKHATGNFEPLDIPSQILRAPGQGENDGNLVFPLDLPPSGKTTVELWYNSSGAETTVYPTKAQSFPEWYHIASNVAWENEIIAYRSYTGIVDFFAKSYPHLRLHDLPPDSYHHERFWGIDPYVVGTKPGLCGVMLIVDGKRVPCYGAEEQSGLTYEHGAYEGGPVGTGAIVRVSDNDGPVLEEHYLLYHKRFENRIRTILAPSYRGKDILLAPGIQKFEDEGVIVDETAGFMAYMGQPVKEYGTIGTALIWNPRDARGTFETEDGCFVQLKPSSKGEAVYRNVAVWYRGSADLPKTNKNFLEFVKRLARECAAPVTVTVSTVN